MGCLALSVAFLLGSRALAAMDLKEAEFTTVKNLVSTDQGPAKLNEKIYEKSKVTTEAASMAELTFADSSITRLGANSFFSFQSKERLIKLDQGSMLIHTPPGNGGATVECGGVTAAVTGTTFLASKDKVGNVLFVLLEGSGGLKVSLGGNTVTIRPGQAASVGTEMVVGEKSSAAPGSPASPAGGNSRQEGGTDPAAASKPPEIKVFEIDIRKVVASTPLIKNFQTPLPSEDKIQDTVDIQQAKVKSGKIEAIGLEVVAVAHEDGDLLVGSHTTWEKDDMVVINRKKLDAKETADGLDVETAAGEGAPPPQGTPISSMGGGVASAPPSQMTPPTFINLRDFTSALPTTTDIKNRTLADYFNLTQVTDPTRDLYVMDRLTQTAPVQTVTLNAPDTVIFAKEMNLGLTALDNRRLSPTASLPLSILDYSDLSDPVNGTGNATGVGVTSRLDTAILQAKYTANGNIPYYLRSVSIKMDPFKLYPEYYAKDSEGNTIDPATDPDQGNMFAGDYAALLTYWNTKDNDAAGSQYANLFNQIGATVDEPSGSPANRIEISLSDYATGAVQGYAGDPVAGLFRPGNGDFLLEDSMGGVTPSGEFALNVADLARFGRGVLADWSVYLTQRVKINIEGAGKNLTFVSGDPGTRVEGTLWDLGSANLLFQSTGSLNMKDSDFYRTGSFWDAEIGQDLTFNGVGIRGSGGTSVSLAAGGKVDLKNVEMAGLTRTTISAGTGVTIENDGNVQMGMEMIATSAGGGAAPNLAVLSRNGALEMKSVSIQGFNEVQLQSDSPQSRGRVLISGTAATRVNTTVMRELVDAAISADTRIQMEALNIGSQTPTGAALAGTMEVGLPGTTEARGGLPVATRLASTMARLDEILPEETSSLQVQAEIMKLSADRINFNNAGLVAMQQIEARANTILVQNSFMTVVRNSGMINFYVPSGLVNRNYGTVETGQLNFAGVSNTFRIGNVLNITIDKNTNFADIIRTGTGTGPGMIVEQVSANNLQAGSINVVQTQL